MIASPPCCASRRRVSPSPSRAKVTTSLVSSARRRLRRPRMLRWRPALVALVPGIVLFESWLRLERPQSDGLRFVLLLGAAAAIALAPRLWQRLVLLAGASFMAVVVTVHVPVLHPWRAGSRLWNGFVDFYDVRLPLNPAFHPEMHALLLLAGFFFAAAVALAAASRRPVVAVAFLVVGAGWPATLLTNGRDLL